VALASDHRAGSAELARKVACLRELRLRHGARCTAAAPDDAIVANDLGRERAEVGLTEAEDAVEALVRQLGAR